MTHIAKVRERSGLPLLRTCAPPRPTGRRRAALAVTSAYPGNVVNVCFFSRLSFKIVVVVVLCDVCISGNVRPPSWPPLFPGGKKKKKKEKERKKKKKRGGCVETKD